MIESMRTLEPSSMAAPDQDDGYVETIALLQEEITRLEAELLAREEASQALAAERGQSDDECAGGEVMLGQEVDELRLELSAREETIGLLLEQLRLVEEAEAANRVEWEQLAQWVAEVEERVERQEGAGAHREVEESETHRREAENAARARHEQERADWAGERRKLEEQIASLEGMIAASAANQGATAPAAALAAVEAENRRLRERCLELESTYQAELQSNRRGSIAVCKSGTRPAASSSRVRTIDNANGGSTRSPWRRFEPRFHEQPWGCRARPPRPVRRRKGTRRWKPISESGSSAST